MILKSYIASTTKQIKKATFCYKAMVISAATDYYMHSVIFLPLFFSSLYYVNMRSKKKKRKVKKRTMICYPCRMRRKLLVQLTFSFVRSLYSPSDLVGLSHIWVYSQEREPACRASLCFNISYKALESLSNYRPLTFLRSVIVFFRSVNVFFNHWWSS